MSSASLALFTWCFFSFLFTIFWWNRYTVLEILSCLQEVFCTANSVLVEVNSSRFCACTRVVFENRVTFFSTRCFPSFSDCRELPTLMASFLPERGTAFMNSAFMKPLQKYRIFLITVQSNILNLLFTLLLNGKGICPLYVYTIYVMAFRCRENELFT